MPVLCLSFAIVLLDQFTKHLVETGLDRLAGVDVVAGLFSLHYVQNTGAAWGILQGLNGWLVLLSFVIVTLLVVFRRHFVADTILARLTAGLILGGIVGNLIDRMRLGYVVDFLDFHVGGHHFPAFNIADSAICVGVGLYLIAQRRGQGHAAAPSSESSPAT